MTAKLSVKRHVVHKEFAAEIAEGVLTPEEASAKIAQHSSEIAIAFQLVDEKLHRYAVALSPDDVFLVHSAVMGDWATNSAVLKIAHDAKSLARENLLDGVVFDTALAAYLVNPGVRAQELADLLERWGDGAQIDSSSPEQALLTSAAALFKLRDSLLTEMKDRGVFALFTDLELPIAHLLAVMENRGIAVDRKELEKLAVFFEGEVARETKAAHLAAGHEFNVGSPKQLQVVLFDELNLPKTKKIKTGLHIRQLKLSTTSKEFIKRKERSCNVTDQLLEYLLKIARSTSDYTQMTGQRCWP